MHRKGSQLNFTQLADYMCLWAKQIEISAKMVLNGDGFWWYG